MAVYERSRARVVRAGPTTTHVALDAWAHGQITVRIDTEVMTTVTGMPRNRHSLYPFSRARVPGGAEVDDGPAEESCCFGLLGFAAPRCGARPRRAPRAACSSPHGEVTQVR